MEQEDVMPSPARSAGSPWEAVERLYGWLDAHSTLPAEEVTVVRKDELK
jgi:hypothetical protein